MCFASLSNLSLLSSIRSVLWQPENLEVIYNMLRGFRESIKQADYSSLKRQYLKYIHGTRTVTNCLLSEECVATIVQPEFAPLMKRFIEFF
mmetsp:Transcript_29513/g.44875  ORF Transcript_29513/g.44875 Transcript_29513/m.44875 type:complete len:91 (+) Transcript_29513:1455-1727(+)